MHEVSIAQNILDIAVSTAKNNGFSKITLVAVSVGKMAAIDKPSLIFAFDALKKDTIAENAAIDYKEVPLSGKCEKCGAEEIYKNYFSICPRCGSSSVKIISGTELDISYIEAE